MTLLLEFYWLTFTKHYIALEALRKCHTTSFRQGVRKIWRFYKVSGAHLRGFSIILHDFFFIVRTYIVLAVHIKRLIIGALVTHETKLKSYDFAFFNFWHCSSCCLSTCLQLGTIISLRKTQIAVRVVKVFLL